MTIKFKNRYSGQGKKEEFFIKYSENAKDMTDQSQGAQASITEMAKKYGIDAIIAKAEQKRVENSQVLDQLYGHDYTQMFTNKEELLNTKKKLNNLFNNIPARIRKETFGDNVMNFITAYTTNDEKKLTTLNALGIVSDTQLNQVKQYNADKKAIETENLKRKEFITKLESVQGELYEKFKETGNININNNSNIPTSNTNVQTNI